MDFRKVFETQYDYEHYMRYTGWEPECTFVQDFLIAGVLGEESIRSTYRRLDLETLPVKWLVELRVSLDYICEYSYLNKEPMLEVFQNIGLQFDEWLFAKAPKSTLSYVLRETN